MWSHNSHNAGVYNGVRYTFNPEKQSNQEGYFFDNHEGMEVIYILEMLKNIDYKVELKVITDNKSIFHYEEINELISHIKSRCATVEHVSAGDHGLWYNIYKHPKMDKVFLDIPAKEGGKKTVFVAAPVSITERPSVSDPEPKLWSADVSKDKSLENNDIVDENPDRILSIREEINLSNHEERYIDNRGV